MPSRICRGLPCKGDVGYIVVDSELVGPSFTRSIMTNKLEVCFERMKPAQIRSVVGGQI